MNVSRRTIANRFKKLGLFEQLEPRTLLAAQPIINEFVASNDGSLLDGFGESSDWIELFNAGDEPADLTGHYLTDNVAELDKWSFPANTQLKPGQYLLVFASGRDGTDPAGSPHTNFQFRSDGDYLALMGPNRRIVSEFGDAGQDFAKQFPDVSFGLGQADRTDTLIGATSQVQVLVPTDNNRFAGDWAKPFQFFSWDQDPQLPGGAVNPLAIKYTLPVRLSADRAIRVRALDGGTWSAVDEAFFEVDKVAATSDNLRVSEVLYNPVNADAEFLELTNIGSQTIGLRGLKLTGGVKFDFSNSSITSLKPGEHVVVTRDLSTFSQVYDVRDIVIAGQYQGRLADEGDRIQLETAAGGALVSFAYNNADAGWNLRASDFGHSLELVFPTEAASSPGSWIGSAAVGGTPGRAAVIPGDANLDGVFNSADLVHVFQSSEYEDGFHNNSVWADGDWNGDGEFTTADLVLAFRFGSYQQAAVFKSTVKHTSPSREVYGLSVN